MPTKMASLAAAAGARRSIWLRGASLTVLVPLLGATPALAQSGPTVEEVVVTATRSESQLSKVPISVAAVSQEQIENKGLKEFVDVVRLTPGVAIGGNNRIAIRGVSSSAGAATTGVYVDDVPIQVRQVGYSASTLFPSLFDLDRVEILRGPQGTLFGAGSQGGTVRFIQPAPNFNSFSGHARTEVSTLRGGGMGYEGGVAVGGPIIADKLAFRVSGYFRRNAGYIDRMSGQAFVRDPTLALGTKSMGFNVTGTAYEDSDWTETTAGRAALAFRPTENLTITASVNYQKIYQHDNIGSVWSTLTDASSGDFRTPLFSAGDPNALLNGQRYLTPAVLPDYNKGNDHMILPYLTVDWSNDAVHFVSTTSGIDRKSYRWADSTTGYGFAYLRFDAPRPGDKSSSLLRDNQKNFTQEIRLQSVPSDSPLTWLVGAFYTNNRQGSLETTPTNFLGLAPSLFGTTAQDDPFPGTSAFLNTFGTPLLPNSVVYLAESVAREKQLAGFAQLDYKITPELTLTVGGRYAKNELTVRAFQDGPENNLNAPYGSECPTPGGCTPGAGVFTPEYARDTLHTKEKVFNPKFSIAWQRDSDNLLYATAAKGFRPGGAQVRLPGVCDEALASYGYSESPTSYKSDSVWSYEAGSKNRLFDGMVTFDGSIYMVKWNKIQTNITLPDCGYNMVDNLGKATSKGFDAAINMRPTENLGLSAAVGYNSTKFDVTTPAFDKGDYVPGTGSPWTITLQGDYTYPLGDERELYVRADATYSSAPRRTGADDPGSPSFNPRNTPTPDSTIVNARVGANLQGVDLSLFVNNLFNFNDPMGIGYTRRSVLFTESYSRPRMIGLSASYRY